MNYYELSLGAAFLGGVLSFLSPCVLPLVPGYLCFAAQIDYDDLVNDSPAEVTRKILPTTLSFVLGFSLVFIAFGASTTILQPFLVQYKNILSQVSGVFIIILGLNMMGLFKFKWLQKEWRFRKPIKKNKRKYLAAFGLGLAFAFGWTPCIGPILAGILALAAQTESLTQSFIMLSIYAAGLAIPFIISSMSIGFFLASSKQLKRHMFWIEKITALLLITTGVFIYAGSLGTASGYLLDWFPFLQELG